MKRIILVVFLAVILLTACTTNCSDDFLALGFIGFTSSDLDTLIVRRYEKNDSFNHLIDTAVLTVRDTDYLYQYSNDTIIVNINPISDEEHYLLTKYDWQINIPAKKITTSISDITTTQTTMKCFDCGCANPLKSYIQNGQLIINPPSHYVDSYGIHYMIYIENK